MQPSTTSLRRRRVAVGHVALAKAIALMARRGGATTADITGETGLHVVTVRKLMAAMCRHGAAHLAGKGKDAKGRRSAPLFKLGSGK